MTKTKKYAIKIIKIQLSEVTKMKVLLYLDSDSLLSDGHGWKKSEKKQLKAFMKKHGDFYVVLDRDYIFPKDYSLEETILPAEEGKHNRAFLEMRIYEVIDMLRENYVYASAEVGYMEFVDVTSLIEHLKEKWMTEEEALALVT